MGTAWVVALRVMTGVIIAWWVISIAATATALSAACFVLAGYFAAVCTVYLLTPQDLPWLISTSLLRVLSVSVPPIIVLSLHDVAPCGSAAVTLSAGSIVAGSHDGGVATFKGKS
jgi:hypothetical protein